MARPPKTLGLPPAPKPIDPNTAVTKPPRVKASSTREYGKGGTPYSAGPDQGIRGAGIGYGGPKPYGF